MAPYRVDRPSEETSRLLAPLVVFFMVVVALPVLASLLWVGYLLWSIAFPAYGSFADVILLFASPVVLGVWIVGGLLLWWLRGILRGLLD